MLQQVSTFVAGKGRRRLKALNNTCCCETMHFGREQ
jgi:hypothetical protein